MFGKRKPVTPQIALANATFRLGDRLVFERTNWAFQPGQNWAVIGQNGSGKSLFADALRGRLPLVSGELHYGFRVPPHLAPEEAIGHVAFEDRREELHGALASSRWNSLEEDESLRVRDFLSYERVMEINPYAVLPGETGARKAFARRSAQVQRWLELAPFLDQPLLTLSNGERQRVQLARALCRSVRLLILDEPFQGVDAQMRAGFHRILQRLMANGIGLLLIADRSEDLPPGITHLLEIKDCAVVSQNLRPRRIIRPQDQKAFPAQSRDRSRNPSGPPLLRLRDVTVRYGSRVVLDRFSWEVLAGESWALVGPNGSGKTTVLSLIAGDHPQAYSNDVEVFGRQRGTGESIWELKQAIGWISPEQHLAFPTDLSVFDTVASGFFETNGLFDRINRKQRAQVQASLKKLKLLLWAKEPLGALSMGLQRMVLLARSLVKEPKLLILDEPFQSLDLEHRKLFRDAINALICRKTTTVLFVSHRPEEIPSAIEHFKHLTALSGGRAATRTRKRRPLPLTQRK